MHVGVGDLRSPSIKKNLDLRGACPNNSFDFGALRACYRVAKTHRIPYLYRSFSAKVTYI